MGSITKASEVLKSLDTNETYNKVNNTNRSVVEKLIKKNIDRVNKTVISVEDVEIKNTVVLSVSDYSLSTAQLKNGELSITTYGGLDPNKVYEVKLNNDEVNNLKSFI